MKEKINISKFSHCYGCGVCVPVCPVKIISLRENKDGFYSPVIDDQDKCIECGLCLKMCAFNHQEVAQYNTEIKAYAAWSNNALVREWCSSGGIGFEIGKKLIEEGYSALGVRYDARKNRAEHFIASTVEDFMPSVGSKYIPSYTADAFNQIDRKKKYLVTGTPCQIDSFRRFIKHFKVEVNYVLLDFFCHGVPSMLLWDKYTAELKSKIGDIEFASWRNKTTGWHDSWSMNIDKTSEGERIDWHDSYNLKIKEKKHFYTSRMSEGDLFYKFFLGNYCLNKCCYKDCKYKMTNSAADIRIGDLWGRKYAFNQEGVSAVLAFTDKGKQLMTSLTEDCEILPESLETATEGQMRGNAQEPYVRHVVMNLLRGKSKLSVINRIINIYSIILLPKRILRKSLRIIRRLNKKHE